MKVCSYCQAFGLEWRQIDGRWRLYAGDSPHICGPERRARAVQAWSKGAYSRVPKITPKMVWSKEAFAWKPKSQEPCPPAAEWDLSHPWWAWLDGISDPRQKGSNVLKELVP